MSIITAQQQSQLVITSQDQSGLVKTTIQSGPVRTQDWTEVQSSPPELDQSCSVMVFSPENLDQKTGLDWTPGPYIIAFSIKSDKLRLHSSRLSLAP